MAATALAQVVSIAKGSALALDGVFLIPDTFDCTGFDLGLFDHFWIMVVHVWGLILALGRLKDFVPFFSIMPKLFLGCTLYNYHQLVQWFTIKE
jgi:hypothetical protein